MKVLAIEVGGSNTRCLALENLDAAFGFRFRGANSDTDRTADPRLATKRAIETARSRGFEPNSYAISFAQWPIPDLTLLTDSLGIQLTAMTDAESAFLSSDISDHGSLLIAGTGSVGCKFESNRIVKTADGLGWPVGDVGSGVWAGFESLRAAARSIDRGVSDPLVEHVCRVGREVTSSSWASDRSKLNSIRDLVAGPAPSIMAHFAPALDLATAEGSQIAYTITERAIDGLCETLNEVAETGRDDIEIVLAGGRIGRRDSLFAKLFLLRLRDHFPNLPITQVSNGLSGLLRTIVDNRPSMSELRQVVDQVEFENLDAV